MAATVADPLLGHLIDGRYEVLSRIARGGMATVYLATDRRLDREVAIKVMHPHLAEGGAGSEFVARFRREARAAARLTHPGLVAVFDQGVDGETSYLTMEYVEGTNLRRHLGEQGALTVREALTTLEAILDALAAAHRVDLVHRDIKPENVLIAGDGGRIKLADFGLARAVTEVTATTAGTVLGTVAYLAPELVAYGASDTRTDIYAAGILLYEMLTGAQPFTGATPIQIAYQHVNSDVPAPSGAVRWLPAEIDDLVGALAAREPDERPSDARAALDLVRRTRSTLDDAVLDRRADVEPSIVLPSATVDGAEIRGDLGASIPGSRAVRRDDPDADRTEAIAVGRDHRRGPVRGDDPETTDGTGRLGRTIALQIGSGVHHAPDVDGEPERSGRRGRALLLTVLVLVFLGASSGIAWWFMTSGPGAYTTVPQGLVAVEVAAAQAVLTEADLESEVAETFDPEIPAGTVISTDPASGAQILKEGSVELLVSKGPDMKTVPEGIVGVPFAEAKAALEAAGLVVPEPERLFHDTVPTDHVISSSVPPATELPVGSPVNLVVSSGREPLTIISVIGATRELAIQQLSESGLNYTELTDFSLEFPAGTVMAQDPAPGTPGLRLDTVTITISQGPPLVTMPDVFSTQFVDAKAELEALGLKVTRENVVGGIFGTVHSQSVKAGESIPVGTNVTLTVV